MISAGAPPRVPDAWSYLFRCDSNLVQDSALMQRSLAGVAVAITGAAVLLAFIVATGVGIFFGFYPATRAARLKPIDALRYQ